MLLPSIPGVEVLVARMFISKRVLYANKKLSLVLEMASSIVFLRLLEKLRLGRHVAIPPGVKVFRVRMFMLMLFPLPVVLDVDIECVFFLVLEMA